MCTGIYVAQTYSKIAMIHRTVFELNLIEISLFFFIFGPAEPAETKKKGSNLKHTHTCCNKNPRQRNESFDE